MLYLPAAYPFLVRSRCKVLASANSTEDRNLNASQAALVRKFNRRFTLGVLSTAGLAIGANFLGVTSLILGIIPEPSRGIKLDVLYPVQGFLRYLDIERGFEFIYPQEWVGDQTILYRAVERAEKERSLDLPSLKKPKKKRESEPIVAFGPPGTNGEINVSVIVAPVQQDFRLDQLGDAKEAGEMILNRLIAPEGSNKTANLLDARRKPNTGDAIYYTLEYTVRAPSFFRHNVAVYSVSKSQLFTLNVQVPESEWLTNKDKLLKVADSFNLSLLN